jgi:opacity protein-like surface antigen
MAMTCLIAPAILPAQSGDKDVGEVALFGGGIFGMGTHPVVGGSSGIAFSKYGMANVEAAFSALGADTLRGVPPSAQPITVTNQTERSHLYDVNVNFHIRIPVQDRWAPYVIIGGGILFNTFRTWVTSQNAYVGIDNLNFGFHTGGGLRYYIGKYWGIRPEYRVVISNQAYSRFTVGVFYTLPPDWF